MSWPVIQRASGEPTNAMTGTMSSTVACLPRWTAHVENLLAHCRFEVGEDRCFDGSRADGVDPHPDLGPRGAGEPFRV
jgi:hypothetical protein